MTWSIALPVVLKKRTPLPPSIYSPTLTFLTIWKILLKLEMWGNMGREGLNVKKNGIYAYGGKGKRKKRKARGWS
jgi:hypothetical protein